MLYANFQIEANDNKFHRGIPIRRPGTGKTLSRDQPPPWNNDYSGIPAARGVSSTLCAETRPANGYNQNEPQRYYIPVDYETYNKWAHQFTEGMIFIMSNIRLRSL